MRQSRRNDVISARGRERAAEIADRLGVHVSTIHDIWREHDSLNGVVSNRRSNGPTVGSARKRSPETDRIARPPRTTVAGDDPRFAWSLNQIGLFSRTANCLEERGYMTVGQILAARVEELLAIPNFGPSALGQLMRCLARIGFPVPTHYLGETEGG